MEFPSRNLEQFMEVMHSVTRFVRKRQWNESDNEPITRTQWMILRTLMRQDSRTIGQLAERLDVRPSTMSQMIDRLELSGLVHREQADYDGRTRIVRLTDMGCATIQKLKASRVEALAQPFDRLTESEQETLVTLMTKLASHLPAGDSGRGHSRKGGEKGGEGGTGNHSKSDANDAHDEE